MLPSAPGACGFGPSGGALPASGNDAEGSRGGSCTHGTYDGRTVAPRDVRADQPARGSSSARSGGGSGGRGACARFPDGEAGGAARIVVDRPLEVVIAASAGGGLLLLADNYYPGWVATADGRTVPVLRANIAHPAVSLPPGNHRVAFEFRPKNSALSTALNLTGMAALALGALVFWGLAGWKGRPTAKDKGASAQTTEREDGF